MGDPSEGDCLQCRAYLNELLHEWIGVPNHIGMSCQCPGSISVLDRTTALLLIIAFVLVNTLNRSIHETLERKSKSVPLYALERTGERPTSIVPRTKWTAFKFNKSRNGIIYLGDTEVHRAQYTYRRNPPKSRRGWGSSERATHDTKIKIDVKPSIVWARVCMTCTSDRSASTTSLGFSDPRPSTASNLLLV